jgi:hypothetical protein
MFYFNPKVRIEVCLCHRHTIPSYGDSFIVSRSDRNIDLRHNAFLSDIAHIDVSVIHKTLIYQGLRTRDAGRSGSNPIVLPPAREKAAAVRLRARR